MHFKVKIKLKWRTDDNVWKKNSAYTEPSADKRMACWYIQQWVLFFKTNNLKYFHNQNVNATFYG